MRLTPVAAILLMTAGVPAIAVAQTLPANTAASLQAAANDQGPRALVARLKEILAQHPQLAAEPNSAALLARTAADPVGAMQGEKTLVYRDIAVAIIEAAPPASRNTVALAVTAEINKLTKIDPSFQPKFTQDIEDELQTAIRGYRQIPANQPGVRLGSFILFPEAEVTEFYDSNVYATKENRSSDYVTVLAPHIFVVSDWDKHSLNFQAHVDSAHYASHEKENSNDFWLSTEGQYDISSDTNLFGGALYGRFHEERSSPDEVFGTDPTIYKETRAFGGASHLIGPVRLRAGVTWGRLNFDNTESSSGTYNNNDRDRDHITSGLSATYRLNDVVSPYIEGIYDQRLYDSPVDDNGINRDSRGERFRVGSNFHITGKLDGRAYIGVMRQDYRDPALNDVSKIDFGGDMRWRIVPSTLLSTWAVRSIEETTLSAASSYLYTEIGGRAEYNLTQNWLVVVRGSAGKSAFEGGGREDVDYDTGVGLRYLFSPRFFMAADYRYQVRDSNDDSVDYFRHQIYLRAGFKY